METVAIGELKQRASEIIRQVEEKGEAVQVTRHGRVVARIVPAVDEETRRRSAEAWENLRRLGKEISAAWPKGVSAVDAIREQRGEL